MRRRLATGSGLAADTFWGLGIAVACAEGGTSDHHVAVSAPTIYLIGEFASLASLYVPQMLAGAAPLILARRLDALPGWLRAFTYLAAVCGIVSPLWLPSLIFLVWGVTFGVWMLLADRMSNTEPRPKLAVHCMMMCMSPEQVLAKVRFHSPGLESRPGYR